jgi:hypothetical protein
MHQRYTMCGFLIGPKDSDEADDKGIQRSQARREGGHLGYGEDPAEDGQEGLRLARQHLDLP